MKNLAALVVVILLAACSNNSTSDGKSGTSETRSPTISESKGSTSSSSLEGTYVAQDGGSLTFKNNGIAYETNSTGKVIDEFKYSVDGTTIKTEDRVWQLTRLPNGSIGSPIVGEMKKQ